MSSWKHYGGINHLGKINTTSLSVNSLLMKEPYVGVFNICGELNVTGNSYLHTNLNVYGNSTFYGDTIFNETISETANITNDIVLGNVLYFNGKSQFIYGSPSGLGINTITPNAALDISTNLIKGFNIYSNNIENINTLAQNNQEKGLQIGVDDSSSFIHFFHDNTIQSGIVDGNISFNDGGILNIDVKQNINLLAPVSISDSERVSHVNGETVVIYDISNGSFFENIYNNTATSHDTVNATTSTSGSALSLISNDTSSNTFMYITTPNRNGLGIGGGAYPDDLNKSMGTIGMVDTSGIYTPTQMIVSGNNKVKYKTTTGINTFKPRIDNYVLDINGPIHIDNGDITNVTGNINFELYSMSCARTDPNNLLAIGSPYDTFNNKSFFKESVLKSIDYGKTWNVIDLSEDILEEIDGIGITSVHMYDQSYCFLTGQNLFLQYSIDGGMNWHLIATNVDNENTNHFFVNTKQNDTFGNIFCHFSFDLSSTFFSFKTTTHILNTEFSSTELNYIFTKGPYKNSCKDYIDSINGIHGYDKTLYIAGNNGIVKYIIIDGPNELTSFNSSHTNIYTYNGIYAFDNSFVIAVGNNIISSTTDGGINWNDTLLDGVNLKSVYIYNSSYAVSVGLYGNIWVTSDSGITWNYMPSNLINSSGKASLITSNNNNFKHVIMPDINTMIISNIITPFIFEQSENNQLNILQNGISNIYNMFIPNFINRSNNIVLDISGSVNISGHLKMSDTLTCSSITTRALGVNGDIITTSPTDSISTDTGALVVTGGVGIGGNLYAKNIYIDDVELTTKIVSSQWSNNETSGINYTGNVGINNSSPAYKLDINGDMNLSSGSKLRFRGSGSKIYDDAELRICTDNDMYFYCTNYPINDSNYILKLTDGIGVDISGDARIKGKTYIGLNNPGAGSGDTAYLEYVVTTGTTNNTEKTTLRIVVDDNESDSINLKPSGNVGINNDSPAYKLDVSGTIGCSSLTSTGKITGLSFNATSDYRLKQNVQLLNETNKSINELKPIEYDLSGGNHDMGFLAHEVQEIFPFLVNGEKDGKDFQSINYNGFIALLVKEIQDLKKEMKIIYNKNDELDKRLKLVENK
jgi:hypothetical protein